MNRRFAWQNRRFKTLHGRYSSRLSPEISRLRGSDPRPGALLGGGELGPVFGRGGVAGVGQGAASLQVLKGLAEGFQQLRV